MIGPDEVRGVDIPDWLPCVIALRVPLPFDEVFQCPLTFVLPVTADLLHLILRFSADKVRRWSGEVGDVSGRFAIGR